MPLLVTAILNALGAIYTFFRKTKLANYAIFGTAVVVILAGFAVVKGAIVALVAGVAVSTPPILGVLASWFVPYNLDDCIAARIAAELAFAVYRWQYNIVLAAAQAQAS